MSTENKDYFLIKSLLGKGCFFHKISATFVLVRNIGQIYKKWKSAYGDKKGLSKVIGDFIQLIWKYRGWVDCLSNASYFVNDYFVERLHLKSHKVEDFVVQGEAIRMMLTASFPFRKKQAELNDKQGFHNFCEKHGFPHIKSWGFLVKSGDVVLWQDTNGITHPVDELLGKCSLLFCKILGGLQGRGAFKLAKGLTPGAYSVNGKEYSLSEFSSFVSEKYIIEEVIENHSTLAQFHPYSLNTIRFVTLKTPTGEVVIDGAFLRIGTGNRCVDNFNSFGVGIVVNEKGIMQTKGVVKDYTQPPMTKHPDTGLVFDGVEIPFYSEACDLVVSAHRKCKRVWGWGWDIAITPTGPVLVEVNPDFGFDLMQALDRPYRKLIEQNYFPIAVENLKRLQQLKS